MKLNTIGRRILIGVGIVVMLLGAAFMYLNYRNRNLSPPGNVELSNGGLTVTVNYSRPSVRDRLIFGPEEKNALQPWGKYWRLGANESTELTLNQDVIFNGNALAAGTYKIYAIPGEESFEIFVNTSLGDWGAFDPDSNLDLFSTNVSVIPNQLIEQHTISLEPIDGGILLIIEFEKVRLEIPVIKA